MCVRSGLNGERPREDAPNDDPERVDDRHAEDQEGNGDLGRPEDGEHGQREAEELDAARAGEDRGRVEVPAQEPEQGTGQRETQHGDERLADLGREADQPQRHGGDETDPGRQPVEAVDPVDAVDHPDDPEDRQPGRDRAGEADHAGRERVGDEVDRDPERNRADGQQDLAKQLRPRPQIEQVVDRAQGRCDSSAEQQRRDLRLLKSDRDRDEAAADVDQEEDPGHEQERGGQPRARHREGPGWC